MDTRDKILRLINEQNNPYKDVSLDNVVMSKPRYIDPDGIVKHTTSGSFEWTPDREMFVDILLDGAGGGSGGSVASGRYVCSYKGGDGARNTKRIKVSPSDVLKMDIGAGGYGGRGSYYTSGTYVQAQSGGNGQDSVLYLNGQVILRSDGGLGSSGVAKDLTRTSVPDALPLGGSPGGAGGCPFTTESGFNEARTGYSGGDGTILISESIEGLGDRNSAVQLTGILNKGYKGTTEVYYKRNDLSELFEGVDTTIRSREFTLQGVIDRLNSRYGLFLESDDLINGGPTVPVFGDDDLETVTPLEFNVKDDSYGWVGTVTVKALYGNPELGTVVIVQLLPVLNHPEQMDEIQDRRSGTISTWAFDFTAYKEDLQIDPETGEWSNFARVQEIGQKAGLTYWYNGRVVDLPTSAVPNANPMFERVMVQETTQGDVLGPIYFHYDANW